MNRVRITDWEDPRLREKLIQWSVPLYEVAVLLKHADRSRPLQLMFANYQVLPISFRISLRFPPKSRPTLPILIRARGWGPREFCGL